MLTLLIGHNTNALIITTLAVILLFSFLLTRITKKLHLPNVTAYILTGILIGPHMLNIIPEFLIKDMGFVTDIALAFIAFGVGGFLRFSNLKENYSQMLIITLFESLAAALLITLVMFLIFDLPLSFCLLLGAIGAATAPASTMMTIKQYNAKGDFVNMLLQVVAMDDVVALVAFSICAAIVQVMSFEGGNVSLNLILLPAVLNIVSIILGVAFGILLNKLITPTRTKDNRLILAISAILTVTGFCTAFDISPLLACMALGVSYSNISKDTTLFEQVDNFSPPILTIFFVLSGMRLDLLALRTAGVIGIIYFFTRIIGKYVGAYLGARLSGASLDIQRYLGLALIPQAGVSIGLAFLGERLLPNEMGSLLLTIILSSGVLYELIGPISAKTALFLSKSICNEDKETFKVKKMKTKIENSMELPRVADRKR